MEELRIFSKYLFPVMLQIIIIALIAFILRNKGIIIGYESVVGVALIVLSAFHLRCGVFCISVSTINEVLRK